MLEMKQDQIVGGFRRWWCVRRVRKGSWGKKGTRKRAHGVWSYYDRRETSSVGWFLLETLRYTYSTILILLHKMYIYHFVWDKILLYIPSLTLNSWSTSCLKFPSAGFIFVLFLHNNEFNWNNFILKRKAYFCWIQNNNIKKYTSLTSQSHQDSPSVYE